MTSPLTAAKQQLRGLMKKRLLNVPQESILTQSHQIFDSLTKFKPYQDAERISIYLAMPTGEVQTDAIVRHALSMGKQVFVPYLHRSPLQTPDTPVRVMDMVHLQNLHDYESLKRDSWGIPSINPTTVHERQRILGGPDVHRSDLATLDLILMPGVAFDLDETGAVRRLGHGKGFYDFFLNRYLAAKPNTDPGSKEQDAEHGLRFYGLALKEQLLDGKGDQQVPMGQFDRKLHGLLLGDGHVIESPSLKSLSGTLKESRLLN